MSAIPTLPQRDARIDIARMCDSGLPGDQLLAGVAKRVREVVPFDGAFISSTDPDTMLCTQHSLAYNMPPWVCPSFFHNEFLGGDYNTFTEVAQRPGGVATLGEATGGKLGRSARHVDINAPLGFGHEARVAFRFGDRTWAVGNLLRTNGDRDFTEAERQFLAVIGEDVARGMRAAALAEEQPSPEGPSEPTEPGVLIFDTTGRLLSATDEACAWLGALDPRVPAGAMTPLGFPLPLAATMLVNRARAHATGRGAPPADTRLRTRTGTGLRLQAAATRTPDGSPGGTVLTITPSPAAELAPTAVTAYELTPREQEVTAHLTRGYAPADIAVRLDLAPDTVQANLATILHKTGTTTRAQLTSRLFTDHYYPSHHAGCRPL